MKSREQVMAEMLHHVLSRCRRCHRRRPCAEYAALEAEYDAFKRGEHEMNQQPDDPLCICGDPASEHSNGHGACKALKTPTQLCGCASFKRAFTESMSNYEPEPETES
jgi:hypothetical protein